jgi:TonB family protein
MILMLAFLSVGVSTAQTPPAALAELVDQAFILPKVADSDHIELEADKLDKVRGSCDRAVLVRAAEWQVGAARILLQNIGSPSISGKQGTGCRFVRDRMVLKIKGFTEADPGASTINSIRRVLLTPEDFLRSRGIPFTLLPGSAPQDPVKISDGDLRPKPLLMVNGAFTQEALAAKYQGVVVVSFVIGVDGRPHNVSIVRGIGLGLDESAARALPLWRFEPGKRGDTAIPVITTVQMNFNLM